MKIFCILAIVVLILSGCGKKSEPKYQVKINKEIIKVS
jgi:hypothetical protein